MPICVPFVVPYCMIQSLTPSSSLDGGFECPLRPVLLLGALLWLMLYRPSGVSLCAVVFLISPVWHSVAHVGYASRHRFYAETVAVASKTASAWLRTPKDKKRLSFRCLIVPRVRLWWMPSANNSFTRSSASSTCREFRAALIFSANSQRSP
jgi:hypothetical protein